jgi:hypothetical protein
MPPDMPAPGTDTSSTVLDQSVVRLRAMPKAERLACALSLSALTRELAWQGAVRRTVGQGSAATKRRFLLQMYGPAVAARLPLGGLLGPHGPLGQCTGMAS